MTNNGVSPEMKCAGLRDMLPGEEVSDALLMNLLEGAEETILSLTNRTALPRYLNGLQARLAVVRYNRLGMEGERARQEGSLRVETRDIPGDMLREICAWRVARVPV